MIFAEKTFADCSLLLFNNKWWFRYSWTLLAEAAYSIYMQYFLVLFCSNLTHWCSHKDNWTHLGRSIVQNPRCEVCGLGSGYTVYGCSCKPPQTCLHWLRFASHIYQTWKGSVTGAGISSLHHTLWSCQLQLKLLMKAEKDQRKISMVVFCFLQVGWLP